MLGNETYPLLKRTRFLPSRQLQMRALQGRKCQVDMVRVALWKIGYTGETPDPPPGMNPHRWKAMLRQGARLEELAEDLDALQASPFLGA